MTNDIIMRVTILLAIIAWPEVIVAVPAVVLNPGFYPNLISSPYMELPLGHLDAKNLGSDPPQRYFVQELPQVRTIPTAVFANGIPAIAHIPTIYNYHQQHQPAGTPVYDFQYPFNAHYPFGARPPARPEYVPQIPREKPADDDGIETLDQKAVDNDRDPSVYDRLGEKAMKDREELSPGKESP